MRGICMPQSWRRAARRGFADRTRERVYFGTGTHLEPLQSLVRDADLAVRRHDGRDEGQHQCDTGGIIFHDCSHCGFSLLAWCKPGVRVPAASRPPRLAKSVTSKVSVVFASSTPSAGDSLGGANPSDFRVLARTELCWAAVKPAPVRPSKMPARAHRERQKDPAARKTCFVPGVDNTIAAVNSTQSLSLSVLGPFVLRANGCEVAGLPRKAQALLAFLALQPDRKIPREIVADLLWTHSGPDQARHSLRQTLVALRKTQAANLVSANADALWIEAGAVEVDACVLETGLVDADTITLSESASRWRGALLGDLPAVSPAFDEWLRTERMKLTNVMARLLRRLATTHVAAGNFDAAVETASQLVGLDTLDEAAHRLLIECLARAGQRAEALHQFETCARVLREELDIAA